MNTYAHLEGSWIVGTFVQDDQVGLPEPWAEVPARESWPPAPSAAHEPHWVGGEVLWLDPRTPDQLAADARGRRDALLAATDWMVTRGMELGVGVPAPWAAYRQALRDLPSQPEFPRAIAWPNPPAV